MIRPFDYENASDFLRDLIQERVRAAKGKVSLRSVLLNAGIRQISLVYKVMKKQRVLSVSLASEIGQRLGLNPLDLRAFELLAALSSSHDETIQKAIKTELNSLRLQTPLEFQAQGDQEFFMIGRERIWDDRNQLVSQFPQLRHTVFNSEVGRLSETFYQLLDCKLLEFTNYLSRTEDGSYELIVPDERYWMPGRSFVHTDVDGRLREAQYFVTYKDATGLEGWKVAGQDMMGEKEFSAFQRDDGVNMATKTHSTWGRWVTKSAFEDEVEKLRRLASP